MNRSVFLLLAILALPTLATGASYEDPNQHLMWVDEQKTTPDTHVAFRGSIRMEREAKLELHISGASWYGIWIDGEYFSEGPDRYNAKYPEYQLRSVELTAGEHTVAVQVHAEGVVTRLLYDIEPFLYFKAFDGGKEVPISWKCRKLNGYRSQMRRINPQLGWIEWLDTRQLQKEWQLPAFDDSNWAAPVAVKRELGSFAASKIGPVKLMPMKAGLIGQGELAEVFGYAGDNPGAGFFLRDLSGERYPAQGVWRRYDLGRVRLIRPKLTLDLPRGAVVEMAFSEFLTGGRVAPWITLSAGDSYNLHRHTARGGAQEFFPLTPNGGRFVEVHIIAPPDKIKIVDETFIDRGYYDKADGEFRTDDELLNRIWATGIETYMACSEDALVDNPTRERGQWMGDVGLVGLEIGAVGFSDISIVRRGLVQMAQCADGHGQVAGLCPGGEAYPVSFALQWAPACVNYWKLSGDRTILSELYGMAQRNIASFDRFITADGIVNCPLWNFIDWGYVSNDGKRDMSLNLHYMLAVQAMTRWAAELGDSEKESFYRGKADDFRKILNTYYAELSYDWKAIGYHRTVLGLEAGIVPADKVAAAISSVKEHMMNCFPNDPSAPRLSDPSANNPRLITPYFSHYAFSALIENGEMDFVLDQMRTCWGWGLQGGRTTWVEVFDTRWSHCHQWAGAPTWILSRYLLGLTPRFDRKAGSFELTLEPASLGSASGRIPLPGEGGVNVSWRKAGERVNMEITPDRDIEIVRPGSDAPIKIKAGKTKFITL